MARLYEYLMSSLPALQFGAKPPFGLERLVELCREKIPDGDFAVIQSIAGPLSYEEKTGQPTFDSWLTFEAALRNELVRIRASRKKTDAARFLRRDQASDALLAHIVLHAHRILAPIESEKFLDTQRWQKLEELGQGHYFDLEALVVYALKLAILLRWEAIERLDKAKALEQAVGISA